MVVSVLLLDQRDMKAYEHLVSACIYLMLQSHPLHRNEAVGIMSDLAEQVMPPFTNASDVWGKLETSWAKKMPPRKSMTVAEYKAFRVAKESTDANQA